MMDTEGSEYDRLFYPYLFEGGTVNAQEVLAQVRHSTMQKCNEVITLRQATLAQFKRQIVAAGKAMAQAFAAGATLFAFGNGGSATDAHDLVSDLVHPAFSGQTTARPLPAVALTHDIAVITAVGNDVGFENIFARQLIAFGRRGDIAFGISTSGNSTNLLQAFAQAKQQGMLTIALVGYDGGKMAHTADVDYYIIAPGDHIPRIQEAQATTYHALIEIVHTLVGTQDATEKEQLL
jgi:D-sedoheptulose 7-phosphate isomerase